MGKTRKKEWFSEWAAPSNANRRPLPFSPKILHHFRENVLLVFIKPLVKVLKATNY